MTRALALAPLALLALATPAAAGGGCHSGMPSAVVNTSTVTVEHACFGPEAARIPLGGTVTWENPSGLEHNIGGPAVEYAELPAGGTHRMTFRKAGLYPYACTLHPGMAGVVLVGVPNPAPPAPQHDTPPPAPQVAVPAAPASPVAAAEDAATSYVPWAVAALAVGVVAAVVLATFTRRGTGVPVTAR